MVLRCKMTVTREMMNNTLDSGDIIRQLSYRLAHDLVTASRVELLRTSNDISGLAEFILKVELPETLNAQ